MHPAKAWTISVLLLLGGILFALIGGAAHDASPDASNHIFVYVMLGVSGLFLLAGIIFKFLIRCPCCERTLWWRELPKPYCGHCGEEL